MLEKANDIFQINPQLGGSMTTAANIVKEQEQVNYFVFYFIFYKQE